MWVGLGATILLLVRFCEAARFTSTQHAEQGTRRTPGKAEVAFLTTLRRALNEELRTHSTQHVHRAPPPQPAQPVAQAQSSDEDRAEDEREEAEAEAEAKSAREELQRIEEASRTQASIREDAVRDEQNALSREHAALHATAAVSGAPVAVDLAIPASMQQNSASRVSVAAPPVSTPTVPIAQPAMQAPAAAPAASMPQKAVPLPMAKPVPTRDSVAIPQGSDTIPQSIPTAMPQTTSNTSQIDSEKTAQLAANIAKVARWKEAQATQMMESAKQELGRVESDGKKAEEAKEWYDRLTLKAQQYVKEAAADREAAKDERKKAEDARSAAEWEAERANGARVQAEQDWQRAQLMQKDAEAAQAQVEKQQAALKHEKLEADLEMRKAEEAHAKSERERAELRLEEMAFQRFMAQSRAAAQAPPGAPPRSSIAIAGEQVRGFGSQSQPTPQNLMAQRPQTPLVKALSSSEAVSKVVLDAAKEVLGPNAQLAAALPPVPQSPSVSMPQGQLSAYAASQVPVVNLVQPNVGQV